MRFITRQLACVLVLAPFVLTGCGGGDGSTNANGSPPLQTNTGTPPPPGSAFSGGNTTTPPATGGNTVIPPTTGSTDNPPTTGGNTATPPATGGNTTTPPATGGGNTTTPPTTGGNTTPPTTGGNTTTPPAKNMAGFVYVAHTFALDMSAFVINAATGTLSEVAGSPYAVDRGALPGPVHITVHPSGKFVYVLSSRNYTAEGAADHGVAAAYAIDADTGALSAVAGSPFTVGYQPYRLTIDPSGKFAYVANLSNVSAYAIDPTTGALSEIAGSPFAGAESDAKTSMAMHPSGKFVYVKSWGPTITTYAINTTTGALANVGVTAGAGGPGNITVDPSGKFAYLIDGGDCCSAGAGILAYRINATTGALSEIAGSPFAASRRPDSIALHPSGKFAYVTGYLGQDRAVAAFTIDSTTGALSEIFGALYGTWVENYPRSVTVDDSGKFVYVIDRIGNSNGVFGFTVNTTTGELRHIGQLATFDFPNFSANYITANRRSQ